MQSGQSCRDVGSGSPAPCAAGVPLDDQEAPGPLLNGLPNRHLGKAGMVGGESFDRDLFSLPRACLRPLVSTGRASERSICKVHQQPCARCCYTCFVHRFASLSLRRCSTCFVHGIGCTMMLHILRASLCFFVVANVLHMFRAWICVRDDVTHASCIVLLRCTHRSRAWNCFSCVRERGAYVHAPYYK